MPIYHVRTSRVSTRDFVINATDREDATVQALNYEESAPESKTLRLQGNSTDATVSIVNATEKDWTEATRKKKGK
jgi:hypothetical protein